MKSKRLEVSSRRAINQDSFIQEWPETGLILFNSPFDPKPGIRLSQGRLCELDGKPEAAFDLIDQFIARYAIDLTRAEAGHGAGLHRGGPPTGRYRRAPPGSWCGCSAL